LEASSRAPYPNGQHPASKVLVPLPDGGLFEDERRWPAGAKTMQERTLELLNDGYALVSTRVDGTRVFTRIKP